MVPRVWRRFFACFSGLRPAALAHILHHTSGIYIYIYICILIFIYIFIDIPGSAKLLLFCQKLCLLTQRRLFSPAGSFQCLHTLASIKIAKRRNLPSKRRNLPAKRRFFSWFRAGLTASVFSPKECFFQQPAIFLRFWETALILHVGRSMYINMYIYMSYIGTYIFCIYTHVSYNWASYPFAGGVIKRHRSPLGPFRRMDMFFHDAYFLMGNRAKTRVSAEFWHIPYIGPAAFLLERSCALEKSSASSLRF